MNTSENLLRGRLASLLAVGFGHRFAVSHWLRQYEPTPKLRFRSVAYQSGMSRSLCVSRLVIHPAHYGFERCL
ncbi:MAG: hypothetical protein HY016_02185 [Nitrosomonadales bacterium]|nr:hypothetical protein [Nitrosomonadales bacterium]